MTRFYDIPAGGLTETTRTNAKGNAWTDYTFSLPNAKFPSKIPSFMLVSAIKKENGVTRLTLRELDEAELAHQTTGYTYLYDHAQTEEQQFALGDPALYKTTPKDLPFDSAVIQPLPTKPTTFTAFSTPKVAPAPEAIIEKAQAATVDAISQLAASIPKEIHIYHHIEVDHELRVFLKNFVAQISEIMNVQPKKVEVAPLPQPEAL